MTIGLHLCVDIDRTPAQVWAAIERIETHVEWMADAVSITFRTQQRTGVGTEFACRTRLGPFHTTDVMTVTEWEANKVIGIEHRGVVTGSGRFTLTPATGTSFCWTEDLRFPWWMGGPAGERAARPLLRRVWLRNLARLRTIVERQSRPRL
ncbi:MAG: SRPBCC family protein [Acidimicrobiia bacterium]